MTIRAGALPLLAALLLAPAGCSDDEPWIPPDELLEQVGGIIGGLPTQGWPQVGAYVIDGGYGGMCTATLVHPEWLLTACHCVDSSGPQDMFYVGSNVNNGSSGDFYGILEAIPHPSCNMNSNPPHDVALLRLNQPMEFMDPIPVNTTSFTPQWEGKWLHYVGFGSDTYYGGPGAGTKRETDIQLYQYDSLEYIHYTPGTNTCSGDSGGPGLVELDGQWYVAGVNSSVGPVDHGQDYCSGFGREMRVDAELNFIDDYFDPYEVVGDDDDDVSDDDDIADDDTPNIGDLPEPRIEDDYDQPEGCAGCSTATGGSAASGLLLLALAASLRRRD